MAQGTIVCFNIITPEGFFEDALRSLDWHDPDAEFNAYAADMLTNADGLLLGRKTFERLQAYWTTEAALLSDGQTARLMADLPKYVVSKTLRQTSWPETELISDHLFDRLMALQSTHKLLILGSSKLMHSLMELGLVGEYRLMLAPVLLGAGTPLFKGFEHRFGLTLVDHTVFKSGKVLLCYKPTQPPKYTAI